MARKVKTLQAFEFLKIACPIVPWAPPIWSFSKMASIAIYQMHVIEIYLTNFEQNQWFYRGFYKTKNK